MENENKLKTKYMVIGNSAGGTGATGTRRDTCHATSAPLPAPARKMTRT